MMRMNAYVREDSHRLSIERVLGSVFCPCPYVLKVLNCLIFAGKCGCLEKNWSIEDKELF